MTGLGSRGRLAAAGSFPFSPTLKGAAVRTEIYNRALLPSYLFRQSVLAWECSICRKIFSVTAEEAERVPGNAPPAHIDREFRLHSCELMLVAKAGGVRR